MRTLKGKVSGRVQGVGFRYFVRQQAQTYGVSGYANNLRDGSVEFLLQGEVSKVQSVLDQIHKGPPASSVDDVDVSVEKFASRINEFTIG